VVAAPAPVSGFEGLPAGLPRPHDDGAARHLPGASMPAVALPSTAGGLVELGALGPGRTIVYVYPATGVPGVPLPAGWDLIPGARGCTPEACGFRDHHDELEQLGAAVYGVSSQTTAVQQEAATRLGLPFALLSDTEHLLAAQLGLPTFEVEGRRLYRRLTLIVRDAVIEHAFYPVFPPDTHAAQVLAWLRSRPVA
jgi:peroxiredoxin